MVEDFTSLSIVEVEVSNLHASEGKDCHPQESKVDVSVSVSVEGIITELVTIWLIVRVWFVHDQVSVGVGREDELVAIQLRVRFTRKKVKN